MAESVARMVERRRREREAIEEEERRARGGQIRPPTAPAPSPAGYRGFTGALREAGAQVGAVGRTMANTLTLGAADSLAAGLDSLVETGDLSNYRANLADQKAQDRYDTAHRPVAQGLGQTLAVLVPFGGRAAEVGARLKGVAAISARELGAMAGGGGVLNAEIQHLTDVATGRVPSIRNDVGAAVGGVAGAAATPFVGVGKGGAVNGAVTSAAQDLLNGRPISIPAMSERALLGRAFNHVADRFGSGLSDALPRASKGELGEALGRVRSALNGKAVQSGSKARDPIGATGKYWYPDGLSGDTRFEYKFGPWAELSPNQTLAQDHLGQDFQLYQFLPEDVGRILGIPAASVGIQADPRLRGW